MRGILLFDEPMKNHTTFGIGGPAACYAFPVNRDELAWLLDFARSEDIPVFFAGSGSNLLVSDRGFDGIVISLRRTFKKMSITPSLQIIAETGVMLGTMVKEAVRTGIRGFESLIGVPGTVGGALVMNAGAYGCEISRYFHSASSMTARGEIKKYFREDVKFSYRNSTFRDDEVILDACFHCEPGDKTEIHREKTVASENRRRSQPLKYRSAGSVFKNPDNQAAGYLIDRAGLKGKRIGGAEISGKHANFIINRGNASSEDVISLIREIRSEVMKKFNTVLDLEIKLLGFPSAVAKELSHG